MAVTVVLSEVQRATLRRLCDTFVPRVEVDDDPTRLLGAHAPPTSASPTRSSAAAPAPAPEEQLDGPARAARRARRARASTRRRTRRASRSSTAFMDAGPDALAGLGEPARADAPAVLRAARPATGRNPNWEAIGYPGPRAAPPRRRGAEDDRDHAARAPATLELDRRRRRRRLRRRRRRDRRRARRRRARTSSCSRRAATTTRPTSTSSSCGPTRTSTARAASPQTADGSIALMAGSNLGGGTTVNWTNCLRTHAWVRERVGARARPRGPRRRRVRRATSTRSSRASASPTRCSDCNGPNAAPAGGAASELGYDFQRDHAQRRPRAPTTPTSPGCMGFGDVAAPSWAR